MSFILLNKQGNARRGQFSTSHGIIQTPVFMNVGTQAAIKAAFRQGISRKSAARSSFPTLILCICGRVKALSHRPAAFTDLWTGSALF
jgi:hypothetical protein